MRPIDVVVIHCSDSAWGDVRAIREWHTLPPPAGRGWKDVGYHYVITNGHRASRGLYRREDDACVEAARPLEQIGAHCIEANKTGIGICLVGPNFTDAQIVAAAQLAASFCTRFGLTPEQVKGHREFPSGRVKQCPMIDMDDFRRQVAVEMEKAWSA